MQRTTSLENNPSWTRHLLRGLFLVMAFILPASIVFLRMSARPSDPHPSTQIKVQLNSLLLEPPAYDPNKPTVVVVMGNGGTEMTDFIQPYVVFAESKKFNVYAVGASRSPATMIGDIKVIPHFSFAEFDRLRIQPDLIVVPYITPRYAAPVIQWIRKTANDQTRFLSVCAGAKVLAATGLLKNHSATTHQSYFQRLRDAYPDTQWIEGVRYVDSDRIVTTGGVTAGVDGALHLLDKLTDRHTAEEIARKVGYPNLQFLDSPEYHNFVLTPAREVSFYAAGANYLFLKNKQQLGIFLYDGVNEIGMAGVMDTYYVSAAYENVTVSAKPQVVRTEHNLFVVAQYDVEHAPRLARLIVPDGRNQPFDPP